MALATPGLLKRTRRKGELSWTSKTNPCALTLLFNLNAPYVAQWASAVIYEQPLMNESTSDGGVCRAAPGFARVC